jgi:hypothetical protein
VILREGDVLRLAIEIRAAEAVMSVIFSHASTMDRVAPQAGGSMLLYVRAP